MLTVTLIVQYMYFKVIHGIITNRGQQISITRITLLSLTLYAQSYFPHHLKIWGKNLEKNKRGTNFKEISGGRNTLYIITKTHWMPLHNINCAHLGTGHCSNPMALYIDPDQYYRYWCFGSGLDAT